MKKILFLVAIVLMALGAKAQVTQVAVLSNEGKLSFFYGGGALENAYEKATDGDVITLSSGSFNAVDIRKAITVRGAGIALEGEKTVTPTYINGEMRIELPEESLELQLNFEGLTFMTDFRLYKAKNVIFQKCEFMGVVADNADADEAEIRKNYQYNFVHCFLGNEWDGIQIRYGQVSILNSVVKSLSCSGEKESNYNITNSIVRSYAYRILTYCNFTNSIIFNKLGDNHGSIGENCSGNNCIVAGKDINFKFGKNITYKENVEELFKEGTFYELTEKAAEVLGTDGTQVGIYGGNFPFETAASGPKVKKFNVSPKTTADGKLSVDIEIAE